MNGPPYYKRYPRDFIEGTIGMSFELKMTYSFVLDLIYIQNGELPDDSRYISGLLGCSVKKWNLLRKQLLEIGKIEVSGEFLTNYRALTELESWRKYSEEQAKKGRKTKKNNDLRKTTAAQRLSQSEPESEDITNVISIMPETKVSSHSKKNGKFNYSEDFETFWKAYPTTPNMPKKNAFVQWKKLDEDSRASALNSIPSFVDYLNKTDTPAVYAERFLSQRRFDGYSIQGDSELSDDEIARRREQQRRARQERAENEN